ncbi:hypothetical protein ACFVY1_43350 [Streptomyces sp. NPDC058293]|uniref:hypothetical protein n=1 Tax=Streptomyces sp. NPDC058293 TaxID=3346429 RepID=UPI0036EEE6FF
MSAAFPRRVRHRPALVTASALTALVTVLPPAATAQAAPAGVTPVTLRPST